MGNKKKLSVRIGQVVKLGVSGFHAHKSKNGKITRLPTLHYEGLKFVLVGAKSVDLNSLIEVRITGLYKEFGIVELENEETKGRWIENVKEREIKNEKERNQ